MTRVVLGHCYTTQNKGDAGIVIATIETIKAHARDVSITGMSTFSSRDEAFICHHEDYRGAGAHMVAALMPEEKLFLFGKVLTSSMAKALSFARNFYLLWQGYMLFRLNPSWSRGDVGAGLAALQDADLFISKGGSFLYNEGGFRGDISLFKMLVPFWAAKRCGARTIILAQSLGPFNSRLSKWMFQFALRYIDRIYLRENRCLRYLDYIPDEMLAAKVDSCPDMAFALGSEGFPPIVDSADGEVHIGLTVVNHHFAAQAARQAYVGVMASTVAFFAARFPEARFHVFPQVLSQHVDGSVDMTLSREVADFCSTQYGLELQLIEGDFDARTLKETYRHMRFFIATRLHSAIFAAAAGVPTLVFGYHGTKAEGIWNDLGLGHLFFDINALSWDEVETGLQLLTNAETEVSAKLLQRTKQLRRRINEVVRNEIFDSA